ncbi:aminotransferase class I/II-fold pyridoxal phosphate-dependent enzyme [Parablautia intestinalis]|jgi:dTDP-4-amino-4,6-dideoxygalactose transaminase|uniref:Aminotransferase class I/II-fold pyridoxal phosphate-dependent enzyme n=1 Tax=Parablautia intestinalis TaxID=2320100 RepID=A0A3A9AX63_9FIRM|nr:aminotransferase class I/II-fold pyridoxal phosphate-dependent enzyme [Parablautia intestinalis]MCI8614775.1 aminotransferase class I/II-fold pyridoxal phosphate-dependent enzyme [Lachnospiraceae bacterium]RKI91736.1 aminotransferase class I/II-fold pyridoxal phosphate-dependent enzyme [Parablautia intestinalis]
MAGKKIYLSSPTMHGEEQEFIKEAFDTNWVAPLGPNVNAFEKELADYVGISHASALSSGTAAIHLALKILGIDQGDLVFVPTLTFSATCNPVVYEKAVPVFIDSEKDTWNMDPKALRKAFEKYPDVKAVIVVHLYGTPAKLDEIMEICKEHRVPLIEDAAESLGSTYKGKHTGTIGDIGIYSFNGNKIITTSGGGMMVSDKEEFTKKATFLATQARDLARHYQHSHIGYNYRMSNIVAGVGRGQLLHLEEHKAQKKALYRQYEEAFADIPEITLNPLNGDGDANCWLTCMTIAPESSVTPNQIMDALEEQNIESRPIWKPMHLQPVFAEYDFITVMENGCGEEVQESVSEDVFNRGFCLPSDIKNTPEDMELIINTVRKCFGR